MSVDDDKNLKNEKCHAYKYESEHLTTSVGNDESVGNVSSALFSSSHVGIDSDSHANVTRGDRGNSTDNEGDGSVEGAEGRLNSAG